MTTTSDTFLNPLPEDIRVYLHSEAAKAIKSRRGGPGLDERAYRFTEPSYCDKEILALTEPEFKNPQEYLKVMDRYEQALVVTRKDRKPAVDFGDNYSHLRRGRDEAKQLLAQQGVNIDNEWQTVVNQPALPSKREL